MMDTEREKRNGSLEPKLIRCKNCDQVLNFNSLTKKGTSLVCPDCGGNSFRPFVRGEVEIK